MRSALLDTVMVAISTLGNGGVIWIILSGILLLFPKTRKSGVIMILALVVDVILCNGILKHVFARVRPCDVKSTVTLLVERPRDYSFPSGHTASAFAAVSALYLAKEKKLWKAACVAAVLMAFSRLYLYVHYPTDIVGGIAVGILLGWVGYELWKWYRKIKKGDVLHE